MRIGVIGLARDTHCKRLIGAIQARGHEPVLVDTSATPVTHTFSIGRDAVTMDGQRLDDVPVFFLRAVMSPVPHVLAGDGPMRLYDEWHNQYMRARERHGFLLSLLLALMARGAVIANPPQWGQIGQLKPFHTDTLIRAGLPVPPTLMTTDPEEARAFLKRHPAAIYKPIMGGDYCRRVDASVMERLDMIRYSPVIFQAAVLGDSIRVTMTRDRVLSSVHIVSDNIDFRAGTGYGQGGTRYTPHTLPPEVEDLCIRALRASELMFSGVDLVRVFPNDYWFLEANYAPAYAEIEERTGHPITEGIVDMLLAAGEGGQPDLRSTPPSLFEYRVG